MTERRGSLVPGAVLLGLGFVFALDRFAGVAFWDAWYWGLVLAGAIVFLLDRWDPRGLLVAIVGLVLWAAERYEVRVRYVWPLLVMGLGVYLIVQTLVRRDRAREDGARPTRSPTSYRSCSSVPGSACMSRCSAPGAPPTGPAYAS